MTQVIEYCKANGLLIGKNGDTVAGFNNVITLSPPLAMTDDDFAFMVKTIKAGFATLRKLHNT